MFWRFGGYANISAIDTILDKPEFTLEELLDESDLIQELKQHNAKLIDYLRDEKVLEKLLEYVVAPKLEPIASPEEDEDEDENSEKGKGRALPFSRPRASSRATDDGESKEEEAEKKRNRYAYVAAEILSSDNWSICEALLTSKPLLQNFWRFLKREAPLDPLQASYFTKVNESLFDKKTEEMIDLLKSVDDVVTDMLRHVDCPMIMDLLLKIISLERTESGQGIVEWLYTQDVMPTLLSYLAPQYSWSTQTSAGDFLKAIITVSANASQNEQTCIGPNELTRQLVAKPCADQLIGYMLGGGNALTVGVGIVIEVIRKNNSDYDPDVGAEANSAPSSRDPIYLGTLLRLFADHVPDFMNLIMNAPATKERLNSTFGEKIEPLGFDRFKTCELMAELLHCSNMGLLNEVGSEELIAARDTERQRLRAEGKLSTVRGEDIPSSAEDLTMRMSHSPAGEGRRLEVTNTSDDDGFEEVTRSAEMTEDTSHEFVKAEEEISAGPSASFLDKDEDDFVDEPLSSPRLHIHDSIDEPHFDEPDLVVAPLSPSKQKAAELDQAGLDESEGPSNVSNKQVEESLENDEAETPIIFTPTISSIAGSDIVKPESVTTGDQSSADATSALPQGADRPAPLFSEKAKESDAAEIEKAETKVDAPASGKETEAGDASIIVDHAPTDEMHTPADNPPITPVVGDYLKMQFVEHKVVPTILSFFFKYPWNNFLHNVVYDIVQQVFNGPMDRGYNPTLAISLFEQADITSQIIHGQLASEQSQQKSRTRMGYMGHLTLIAEEVVKFTERHPPELLSETVLDKVMSQDWINYVEGSLAETRERDNAILGGVRPEVAMNNRAASSGLAAVGLTSLGSALSLTNSQGSGLAEAGLNGDMGDSSGNGIGPFAISSGTLMSGFGSSSDEDEDEEVDNEEDVNNEFRAYTDPLNASNSSMNPPSIPPPPPPPPPLNIPPSRARLQFAARLAMSKRKAEGQEDSNGDEEGEGNGEPSSLLQSAPVEPLRDPFADDDDGEDENRNEGDGSDDEDRPDLDDGSRGGGWNRGAWWRGVVRRRPKHSPEKERFGDGRDDSDEEDRAGSSGEEDEFGDFAMPEDDRSKPAAGATEDEDEESGSGSDFDREREKVLFKPLAVHPPQGGNNKTSAFSSLWPFGNQPFGLSASKDREKKSGDEAAGESQEQDEPDTGAESAALAGEPDVVVGEDGNKVERAVKARRRTSIEDPDEDEGEAVGRQ
ncbi:Extragenic suppressor of kinetochore protein 1 [Pleurostoma richardsiae]|uniref:Extragenic suppressor of kinetochore protein 1 n=1 Tax=Pleurostoma richardsiae TaxID=41990 RepID=A0AA38VK79_9PEZI|nr:Extragenic suppressor of kinetochore protein 1 [Pleurostoma richardsiae]